MKKIIRATTSDDALKFVEPHLVLLKNKYKEVQLLSSPGKKMDELCARYGLKGHSINISRRISLFNDIKSLFRIIKIFRIERPDMVHSMTPKAGLLCMLAGWITKVPCRVHSFTGLIWPTSTGLRKKLLMFTDWVTCICATHILPESVGVMNDLQSNITKKKMRVLGFGNVKGIDLAQFSYRSEILRNVELIKRKKVFTFLFVGRLVSDKGVNELIKAFTSLFNQKHNIRLLLVGEYENDLDPLLPETIKEIDTNPNIEYLGTKYDDDLITCYAISDCFVLPSYREGFPNVLLEAGAMNLPSIVTNVNGSREIIEDGLNGLIIPPKNVESLYLSMQKIVSDTDLVHKMRSNARSIIANKFEQSYVQKCLIDFYDEIL